MANDWNKYHAQKKEQQLQNTIMPLSVEIFNKLVDPIKRNILAAEDMVETYWNGGKGGGKTRPVVAAQIDVMFNGGHTISLRATKDAATKRLYTAINNMLLEFQSYGAVIPNFHLNGNIATLNASADGKTFPTVEFNSYDDLNNISGIEGPALGRIELVHVEEPVAIGKQPPTPEEWDQFLDILKKSIDRVNLRYALVKKCDMPICKYHFTFNPWDNHPIVSRQEILQPQHEFLTFIKEDVLNNHTQIFRDASKGRQYVRLTRFADPITRHIELFLRENNIKTLQEWEEITKYTDTKEFFNHGFFKDYGINSGIVRGHLVKENGEALWKTATDAIERNDYQLLTSLLGLAKPSDSGIKKTYPNHESIITADTTEILANKELVKDIFVVGIDIDLRTGRGFHIMPVWHVKKEATLTTPEKTVIVVGKMAKINTFGDGPKQKKYYQEQLLFIANGIANDFIKYTLGTRSDISAYIDENKWDYAEAIISELPTNKAVKHGKWRILKRQIFLNRLIDGEGIIIDIDNKQLLNEIANSVIAEGDKQRDESKGYEKGYDALNALEYALYRVRGLTPENKLTLEEIKWTH